MSDPATVLIVEDEFAIADLLEMALTAKATASLGRRMDARVWSALRKVRQICSSPIS